MSARASILPVFVPHLGCPHACVFCNQRRISGETESADAQKVREILAAAPAKDKKRELAFYGGSFTAIPESQQTELLTAAQEGIERGIVDSIRLSTRPDAITVLLPPSMSKSVNLREELPELITRIFMRNPLRFQG